MKKKSIFMVVLVLLLSLMMGTQVSAASTLASGKTVQGTVKSGSKAYKIKVSKAGYIKMVYSDKAYSSSYSSGKVQVLNSKKKTYCVSGGAVKKGRSSSLTSYVAVKKGTYYIKISGKKIKYKLKYQFVPAKPGTVVNVSETKEYSLTEGKTVSGLMYPKRAVSEINTVYKFNIDKGVKKVSVTLKGYQSNKNFIPIVTLDTRTAPNEGGGYVSVGYGTEEKRGNTYSWDIEGANDCGLIAHIVISNFRLGIIDKEEGYCWGGKTSSDYSMYYTLKLSLD